MLAVIFWQVGLRQVKGLGVRVKITYSDGLGSNVRVRASDETLCNVQVYLESRLALVEQFPLMSQSLRP